MRSVCGPGGSHSLPLPSIGRVQSHDQTGLQGWELACLYLLLLQLEAPWPGRIHVPAGPFLTRGPYLVQAPRTSCHATELPSHFVVTCFYLLRSPGLCFFPVKHRRTGTSSRSVIFMAGSAPWASSSGERPVSPQGK